MTSSENHKSSHEIYSLPWKLYLLVSLIGLFLIGIINYGYFVGNYMVRRSEPFISGTMQIQLEAASGHLWLEESLAGDKSIDLFYINDHFDRAGAYINKLLDECDPPESRLLPGIGGECRGILLDLQKQIVALRETANRRFEDTTRSRSGSEIDQEYDAIYLNFIEKTRLLAQKLRNEIDENRKVYQLIQLVSTGVGILLLAGMIFVIHRFARRRAMDLRMINDANSELKKALEEVRSLQGIIPICGYCKKIRDDQGLWNQLEAYIKAHSDAEFSHGICPDCYEKQMDNILNGKI